MPPCAGSEKLWIFITQHTIHIIVTTFANLSPNSSNLFVNGSSSSYFSFAASYTSFYIFPISVFIPVLHTIPIAVPFDTKVPENKKFILSCTAALLFITASVILFTGFTSPVNIDLIFIISYLICF